jgi:hypothetical protein
MLQGGYNSKLTLNVDEKNHRLFLQWLQGTLVTSKNFVAYRRNFYYHLSLENFPLSMILVFFDKNTSIGFSWTVVQTKC